MPGQQINVTLSVLAQPTRFRMVRKLLGSAGEAGWMRRTSRAGRREEGLACTA